MKHLIFISFWCLICQFAWGQYSFTATATATATISATNSLTVTSLIGTSSITTINDYLNGQINANAAAIAIKSNIPWLLEFASNAAFFTAAGGGASTNMPCGVASIRVNGTSTFKALSTSIQTLVSGNRGDATTNGNTFNIDVNFNPGFSYSGGSYSIAIIYTLTNQ